MMMKKRLIVSFAITALVSMTAWFVYPRYRLYGLLEEYKDIEGFHGLCNVTMWDFTNYYNRFFQYPESSEDSVFRALSCEIHEYLIEPYIHGVFLREDTVTINDSIVSVFKLYLKGPNHNEKHIGEIINPYDYENDLIIPVNIPFYKFLFIKGDILFGIILEYSPCERTFSHIAHKEKLSVHDTIVNISFRRAISIPYREKYGRSPIYIRDFYRDVGYICYEANLHSDTLILTQACEPFNGEYDTSPMAELLNKPLYTWAKEIGLHQFYFSIEARPSFFERKFLD